MNTAIEELFTLEVSLSINHYDIENKKRNPSNFEIVFRFGRRLGFCLALKIQ